MGRSSHPSRRTWFDQAGCSGVLPSPGGAVRRAPAGGRQPHFAIDEHGARESGREPRQSSQISKQSFAHAASSRHRRAWRSVWRYYLQRTNSAASGCGCRQ